MSIFAADGHTKLDPRFYAYGGQRRGVHDAGPRITSAGMFLFWSVSSTTGHTTRDLNKLGGLASIMPLYGAVFLRDLLRLDGSAGPLRLCREVFVVLLGVQL